MAGLARELTRALQEEREAKLAQLPELEEALRLIKAREQRVTEREAAVAAREERLRAVAGSGT